MNGEFGTGSLIPGSSFILHHSYFRLFRRPLLLQFHPWVFRIQPSQFAQNFFGPFIRNLRDHHLHFHKLISARIAAQRGRAFPAQAQFLAALRSGRNLDGGDADESRHFHLRPQGRLGDRDRNLNVDIVAFALEDGMRFNFGNNVKIAGGAAVGARVSFPGTRTREPVSTPGGMRTSNVSGRRTEPRATAGRARAALLARSAAIGAGHGEAHGSVLTHYSSPCRRRLCK